MSTPDRIRWDHLERLSDDRGLFEHADGTTRRVEHGYCTDDNARLLVVTSREPDAGPAHALSRLALQFVREAQHTDGRSRNRMDAAGRWTDGHGTDDCWGRSLWGLGSAASQHDNPTVRRWARRGFDIGVRQRSDHPRAMAFAAIGAADVLSVDHHDRGALALLVDALAVIGGLPPDPGWCWPHARLAYANAALAEGVIAAGVALDDPPTLERGLTMLRWLLDLEMAPGHLSVTGVEGRGQEEFGAQFDQQPIEAAAMADACQRAYAATGDSAWSAGVLAAAAWFDGDNDSGRVMRDDVSGGGFDGLRADGVNLNQGAESTLALVSTMQRAHKMAMTR